MEFLSNVDIANRALQHCGARRIDPVLGFAEDSTNARAVSDCYGKLRRAELQRNTWVFATKRAIVRPIDTTTMLLQPALWVSTATYFVGSIVADETSTLWISNTPNNTGNQPQNSLYWEPYFGPMSVIPFVADSYSSGELVYIAPGDGTYNVYLSLQNANSDNPATTTAWSSTVNYNQNDVVTFSSVAYMSRMDLNLGQTPSASAADWVASTTYAITNRVNGSNGFTYQSTINGNIGNDPVFDGGVNWTNTGVITAWTTSFVGGTGSLKWRQIGGAAFPNGVGLATINIVYPLTAGPSMQAATRNFYRLPAGFLRLCSQDPKAGSTSYLGAPTGLAYKDWLLENNYFVTRESTPIMLRFVADINDVRHMDDMFCEGLACRIAREISEPITQSTAKHAQIDKDYDRVMGDARTVNAIEVGSEEPPIDDWIAVRV